MCRCVSVLGRTTRARHQDWMMSFVMDSTLCELGVAFPRCHCCLLALLSPCPVLSLLCARRGPLFLVVILDAR